ncbi:5-formyltetrahydrofolate cyclo-ligase [Candidatus Aerophobetes bacterium]|uniref:5-formyltetrahydrofolate cyclo-ligase n=1 Tax=Aerophobetes bacterium TaxID=2030807 RepID=A0A523S5T2_UNCAE|nr:MAG: 5-formyltetrahydrofolate cyclo-ligase [Candidatus Aerophobetes bacterium]
MEEKKRKIRQEFLKKRNNLSRDEIKSKSEKIEKELFSLPEFQRAKTVMFYVSFRSEVETEKMIRNALKLKKKIVIPVVHGEKIVVSEIKNLKKELTKGSFGIKEPKKEFRRRVNQKEIDLVVVPGVVFDKRGGRLGYGRGYYDRFLRSKSIRSRMSRSRQCALIGLAFDLQIARKIPLVKGDMKVDKIVTESGIVDCKDRP